MRTLSVASNLYVPVVERELRSLLTSVIRLCSLTGVTSFSHLLNLENLDISRNQVDSLRRKISVSHNVLINALKGLVFLELECLRHLRELRADGNQIDDVDGLQKMDGLIKLSLQGNAIREIDLEAYRW